MNSSIKDLVIDFNFSVLEDCVDDETNGLYHR